MIGEIKLAISFQDLLRNMHYQYWLEVNK